MAGYKAKISFNNIDSIRALLHNQVINKATIEFNVLDGSQSEYLAHDKLVLVRTNSAGENIFLSDFLLEGNDYFGGDLNNEKYQFNITRYLYQLLTNLITLQNCICFQEEVLLMLIERYWKKKCY